jgi:PPK2 family polyphosphate:nucleotide phosphotransferase
MKAKHSVKELAERYCVTDGEKFRLKNIDPEDTFGLKIKDRAAELLGEGVRQLAEWQEKLYAQDRWSVLLIFQAMDAAGKDSTIKHVMSGVNPQGCEVHAFKSPSPEEMDHDFLWRCLKVLPRRGNIGIFNRSYYEEMLVVRVHSEYLAKQQVPEKLVTKDIWKERFEDVAAVERYLARQGVVIRKFFLYVSKEEQKRRFLKRLEEPEKNWKFSIGDVHEREHFDDYMEAYEDLIRHTATPWAPWYVIPADHKWFARLAVADAVIDTIESLNPTFPEVDPKLRREFKVAKAALLAEKGGKGKNKKKGRAKSKTKGKKEPKAKSAEGAPDEKVES